MKRSFLVVAMLMVLCCALVACGSTSSLTMEKYEEIEVGMTLDEVVAILGDYSCEVSVATTSLSSGGYMWIKGTKTITVSFIDGVVVSKMQVGL